MLLGAFKMHLPSRSLGFDLPRPSRLLKKKHRHTQGAIGRPTLISGGPEKRKRTTVQAKAFYNEHTVTGRSCIVSILVLNCRGSSVAGADRN